MLLMKCLLVKTKHLVQNVTPNQQQSTSTDVYFIVPNIQRFHFSPTFNLTESPTFIQSNGLPLILL
jgi:hypothetical protein